MWRREKLHWHLEELEALELRVDAASQRRPVVVQNALVLGGRALDEVGQHIGIAARVKRAGREGGRARVGSADRADAERAVLRERSGGMKA